MVWAIGYYVIAFLFFVGLMWIDDGNFLPGKIVRCASAACLWPGLMIVAIGMLAEF